MLSTLVAARSSCCACVCVCSFFTSNNKCAVASLFPRQALSEKVPLKNAAAQRSPLHHSVPRTRAAKQALKRGSNSAPPLQSPRVIASAHPVTQERRKKGKEKSKKGAAKKKREERASIKFKLELCVCVGLQSRAAAAAVKERKKARRERERSEVLARTLTPP